MMKKFMASGSITRGMELNEVPNEGDVMPFPGEDTVMTTYDGCPSPGMCRVSNLSLGTPAHCGWGRMDVRTKIFQYLCTITYEGIWICTL
jgi:hypothetical protein